MSRQKPRIRLANVATPMTPAAFTSEWFSLCKRSGLAVAVSGMRADSNGTL
jgi:hypothetical protein